MLTITQGYGWIIKSSDVSSAFLQGEELERTVHLKPPKEIPGSEKMLMKLKVALYGLNDASLAFYRKVATELKRMGCIQSKNDPAFYYFRDKSGTLRGCVCTHVDDFLHCGDDWFEEQVILILGQVLKMGTTEASNLTYVGYEINQTEQGLTISQDKFVSDKVEQFAISPDRRRKTEEPLDEEELKLLRQVAGKAGWLANGTRFDLSFDRVLISTRFNDAKIKDLIYAEKVVRRIKEHQSFYFIPAGMGGVESWELHLYTDASLGNLGEKSTAGFVLFLVGNEGNCAPLAWCSNRIVRVVNSALAAETLAMEQGVNEGIYKREMIEEIFNMPRKSLKLHVHIDSKSLYQAINGNKLVSDKRLRRDIAMLKQAIQEKDYYSLNLVKSKDMLADVLTKKGVNCANIMNVLYSGNFNANREEI